MSTTPQADHEDAWRGFQGQAWRDQIDVRDFIVDNYTPYARRLRLPVGPDGAHEAGVGEPARPHGRRAGARHTRRRRPHAVDDHLARARPPRGRDHRRAADRRPAEAGDHAQRRLANGREQPQGLRLRARPCASGRSSPSTARPTTPGCSTPTPRPSGQRAREPRPDRAAGRLRPRPDHRRLPAAWRCTAWTGWSPPSTQERARPGCDALHRRRHPRPRGAGRADRALGELRADGCVLRLRHLRPGDAPPTRPSSGPTSPTSARSRSRTARPCRWAARAPSSTSTWSATSPRARLTEEEAQELVDDFVIKLRIVRFLRTPEYDALFSGDPTWVTESIGGMGVDGRPLVTRTSFRFLQTLYNLGPAPEPNLTVFWSAALPDGFKRFAAKVSIDTSAIQYENDELMRPRFGDDTAIACCVSAMPVGKQMQFFGARVNLAKTLLYAINGGRDEVNGKQVGPVGEPVQRRRARLRRRHEPARRASWSGWPRPTSTHSTSSTSCTTSTPTSGSRWRCTTTPRGAPWPAGSPGCRWRPTRCRRSSTRRVRPVRDETGLVVDYDDRRASSPPTATTTTGSTRSPCSWSRRSWRRCATTPRTATPTTPSRCSPSRATSCTASTPATPRTGAAPGEPFAPGANPMHGRDHKGLVAAALSVAKLPYDDAEDGISLTASVLPGTLGKSAEERIRRAGRHPRRLHGLRRLPHERQRPQPGDLAGGDGAPRRSTRS